MGSRTCSDSAESPGDPAKTSNNSENTYPPCDQSEGESHGRDAHVTDSLDLGEPQDAIWIFQQAAQANLNSANRRGATAHLAEGQELLITGDLHDNGVNLLRILKRADLQRGADRHLVLHEIVHGPNFVSGCDLSIRTLARIAVLKLQNPDQVHLMLGNHELAQLGGGGISKDGVDVVKAFNEGAYFIYGEQAEAVLSAMQIFIRSFLLAVRCPNDILCCHSVPSPRKLDQFDHTVIDRVPTVDDLMARGHAHDMVWGRNHTPETAAELARRWSTNLFVMGHQPAEMGYVVETPTMLVIASDHEHGMVLPINTSKSYDMDNLVENLVPLASVV